MATAPGTVCVPFRIRRAGGKVKGKFINVPAGKDDQEVEFSGQQLTVNFMMVDDGGTGLLFPDDASRALWVHTVKKKTDPCPPDGATWPGFRPLKVLDSGKTLQVHNPNGTEQLFKFSLNFTTDPSNPAAQPEPWDPIGSNRNGGRLAGSLLSTGTVLAIGGAFVAGAAVAALLLPKG